MKPISIHQNSIQNLVIRQQAALVYLRQYQKCRRIINIDETWLGMEDFRKMKWQASGTTNSVAKRLWQPRVSMILAFDNHGASYVALS